MVVMPAWQAAFHERQEVPGYGQHGYRPIVVVFGGRRYTLNDDAQHMVWIVANRYCYRHSYGARSFGLYVLLLAKHLGVDVHTATNLSLWLCPNHVETDYGRVVYTLPRGAYFTLAATRARRRHVQEVNDLRATAAAYLARHGTNPPGPYTCRGCGAQMVMGNNWDNPTGVMATPGGVRTRCGRCEQTGSR